MLDCQDFEQGGLSLCSNFAFEALFDDWRGDDEEEVVGGIAQKSFKCAIFAGH